MWIQKNFYLANPAAIPAAVPAVPPITAWAAVESPATPADCNAEKTPAVAPP